MRAVSLAISHYMGMVLHRGLCLRMALRRLGIRGFPMRIEKVLRADEPL